ncbi:MAG: hypothetical protein U9R08_02835 [Nanoarchaeota archaeon]|nr:hypothetical protein [Nanoarchaeota archaeon]
MSTFSSILKELKSNLSEKGLEEIELKKRKVKIENIFSDEFNIIEKKRREKSMEKVNHKYSCLYCGKPATIKLQKESHRYKINKNGHLKEIKEFGWIHSEWYCDECFR